VIHPKTVFPVNFHNESSDKKSVIGWKDAWKVISQKEELVLWRETMPPSTPHVLAADRSFQTFAQKQMLDKSAVFIDGSGLAILLGAC
jgi:hypothetical protein